MSCFNIYRILVVTKPVRFDETIVVTQNGVDVSEAVQYSWSSDNVCWTDFTTRTNYLAICRNIESDYYLRIRFVGDVPRVLFGGLPLECYTVYLDNGNRFEITDCSNTEFNFFNNITCALQLQQQMADKVACLFGIDMYYFRVLPEGSTKDLTFKEYTLHGVEDVKLLKLIIPDGQMPSSKPTFTDFDFDWELDWETEVSKTQFARAFGATAYPKQRDFVYIPMMKRMYEVNSAYDEKEGMLMWQSTTWKLGLIKWNEKTNIDYTGFEGVIDQWAINRFDIDGEIGEQRVESGYEDAKIPKFITNNLHNVYMSDGVRQAVSENSIVDFAVNHKNISITQHIYAFKEYGAVLYQQRFCGDNGTLSFVLNTDCVEREGEFDIVDIGDLVLRVILTKGGLRLEDAMGNGVDVDYNNTYIVNYVWNRSTFSTEFSVYRHTFSGGRFAHLPLYKRKADMYTFDYVGGATGVYNNDYSMSTPKEVAIFPYPVRLTNLKLYNTALDSETLKVEMLKYNTKHEGVVVNDNCIPFESGFGGSNK